MISQMSRQWTAFWYHISTEKWPELVTSCKYYPRVYSHRKSPVITCYSNPIYRVYNPIEITSYHSFLWPWYISIWMVPSAQVPSAPKAAPKANTASQGGGRFLVATLHVFAKIETTKTQGFLRDHLMFFRPWKVDQQWHYGHMAGPTLWDVGIS